MTPPAATPLARLLAEQIAATGPITFADYMAACLMHPVHGYYTTRDPLGAEGDFTTAPEVTQMFGELVGLALAQAWRDQGAPAPFTLAELGPGRGTLMSDLWRAVRGVPGFQSGASVHLVETSAPLRAVQAERLAHLSPRWLERIEDLPEDRPLYLVANELLDALPVRQFHRDPGGWRETVVALQDGVLGLALGPPAPVAVLDHRLGDTKPGDIVELCPALSTVVAEVARRIAGQGGLALFMDYGGWRSRADTVQAIRAHRVADPMAEPGQADLTAHVDFEAVAAAARAAGAEAWGPEEQGLWLGRLGLVERAEVLARALPDDAARQSHFAAFRRLTEADQMGTVFKAMAITPKAGPPPAGFAGLAAGAIA
ncbi:MAG: SAM-dependent methyltransferase [Pseudomonadota bacterium]